MYDSRNAPLVEVVEEKVRHRGLGRRRLQGRVAAKQARRGVETGVRNAPLPHAAVVAGPLLGQVLNGVERVGALVNVLFGGVLFQSRAHVLKCAFRHEFAPHVLKRENVAFVQHGAAGADAQRIPGPVRRNGVRRALEHDGVAHPVRVAGSVHDGVELHPVAHRDLTVELAVVLAHKQRIPGARGSRGLGGGSECAQS